jgi:hypothetical protein
MKDKVLALHDGTKTVRQIASEVDACDAYVRATIGRYSETRAPDGRIAGRRVVSPQLRDSDVYRAIATRAAVLGLLGLVLDLRRCAGPVTVLIRIDADDGR